MPYQPSHATGGTYLKEICLYTTPLRSQRTVLRMRKPIDVFAHWAVCIEGQCYELTRNNDPATKKKEKFKPKFTPQQEWLKEKEKEKRECIPQPVGHTSFSPENIQDIALQVWAACLKSKYVYDEQNCQVFIRLLVDLIGDDATRASFPQYFDKWVKAAGIVRDSSTLLIAAGGSTVLAAASLLAVPADPTMVTAASGAALSISMALRSATALMTDRYIKDKDIKKSQEKLKEQIRLSGNWSR